jgi:hypothetical protein
MTTSKVILNEKESLVLFSLNQQAKEYTNGEFGFMPAVKKCGLSDKEFAGYISSLEAKGIFEYNDKTGGPYKGQFAINKEFKNGRCNTTQTV